ncbi:MAG: hypothetical protein HY925_15995, partial [Elusimicrobia bacterium]|nr:hypothetical protein [Elusimicrobiota bacterium]
MNDISISVTNLRWLSLLYFELVYIVLPGVTAYRLLSAENRILRLAAVGVPLGHAICIAFFLAAKTLGAPALLSGYPLFFAALGAAALLASRGVKAVLLDADRGDAASLAALLAALAAVVYLEFYLRFQIPGEHPALYAYESDLSIFLSLIAELKLRWPPQMPFVAGEALNYHYFAYARMSAMSMLTGAPLDQVLYR